MRSTGERTFQAPHPQEKIPGPKSGYLRFSLLSGAGGSAYVVYPEVEKFAQDLFPAIEQDDYDDAVILAAAMSDEIGHLLLGDSSSITIAGPHEFLDHTRFCRADSCRIAEALRVWLAPARQRRKSRR